MFGIFSLDGVRETIATIRKNKMRTALTGFAVAWGIFMLIVLLAAGNGLRNGVEINMSFQASNSAQIWGGWTSMPYKGFATGRRIRLTERDVRVLKESFPEIEHISGAVGTTSNISYNNKEVSAWVCGVSPGYMPINNLWINEGDGRFINDLDENHRRKVIVLHPIHVDALFEEGEDPVGKYVAINNVYYRVIGVYQSSNRWDDDPDARIPLSYAQEIFNRGWGYWRIEFTVNGLNTIEQVQDFNERVRKRMAGARSFNPEDKSAVGVWNFAEQGMEVNKVFVMINIFILIIGMASLMAGLVGVGNIMLITVKERTREIGIRKSIGATRFSILKMIITEAVIITTAAGYIGIVLGVTATEIAGKYFVDTGESGVIFVNPSVDIPTVLLATLFLIVCGIVCGVLPALQATKVSPIEAMRAD